MQKFYYIGLIFVGSDSLDGFRSFPFFLRDGAVIRGLVFRTFAKEEWQAADQT